LRLILFLYFLYIFFLAAFPDPLELATGMEKKEMLMRLAGNDVSFLLIMIL